MAITGTKLFSSGEVLTAANVNQYLMRGVKVFASTAVRDAAYGGAGEPTLEEGETCYITATDQLQVYNGSTWQAYPTTAETDLIGLRRINGGTAMSYDNVFTTDYRNYKINFSLTNSTSQAIYFRFRAAAADNTTTNYFDLVQGVQINGTANNILASSQDKITLGYAGNVEGLRLSGTIDVMSPQTATNHFILGTATSPDSTFSRAMILNYASYFGATTQFDGFKILPNSGTITGTVQIYGYKD